MEFKDRLRELRLKAGLTQQELADRAGLPVGSLRGHEQGQRVPSWPSVVRIAKALGVPTDTFAECDEVRAQAPAKKSHSRPPKAPPSPPPAADLEATAKKPPRQPRKKK
jgi:transcriptional regulator with XRE-family HTH domain